MKALSDSSIQLLMNSRRHAYSDFFFLNDTAPTEIYTLPQHDALPISKLQPKKPRHEALGDAEDESPGERARHAPHAAEDDDREAPQHHRQPDRRPHVHEDRRHQRARDRKSTRLNSSHSQISYAVFCLK